MDQKIALLIGNDAYSDSRLERLNAPPMDVYELQSVLKDKNISGFDEIKLLVNAPRATVEREIGALFAGNNRDDVTLLYFSGHGVLDAGGGLFLAVYDTQTDQLLGTGVQASFIREAMNQSRSRRQVLILDCCNSGAFKRGAKGATKGVGAQAITGATFETKGYGREILVSSTATQYAWDGESLLGEPQNSMFTKHLIHGLKSGEAAPGKEEITVEQLYNYVHKRVVKETPDMTPHRWVDEQEGTFIIAKNPNPKAPREVAEEPFAFPANLIKNSKDKDPITREGAVRMLGKWLFDEDRKKCNAAGQMLREMLKTEKYVDVRDAIAEALAQLDAQPPPKKPPPETSREGTGTTGQTEGDAESPVVESGATQHTEPASRTWRVLFFLVAFLMVAGFLVGYIYQVIN